MIRKNVWIVNVDYEFDPVVATVTYRDGVAETYTDPDDLQAIQQVLKVQAWQSKVTGANNVAN